MSVRVSKGRVLTMLSKKGTPCARTKEATILRWCQHVPVTWIVQSTHLPSSAATYNEIAVLNIKRLVCIASSRASFERMPGKMIRRIARNRCQKTVSTWTRPCLLRSSFEDFFDLRDDEEDELFEPEIARAVDARMKIVNEILRQRWTSGRCCKYSAASDDDERSLETAGAILNCPGGSGSKCPSWHVNPGI